MTERNFAFGTRDWHSDLARHLRLSRGTKGPRDGFFPRAESYFNVATGIESPDDEPGPRIIESYGGESLHERSHGKAFTALLLHRFRGNSPYPPLSNSRPPEKPSS